MDDLLARALGGDTSQLVAEQRQALLSRLLSRLAHEVRNPLSSLDVHVQLLEEDLHQLPGGTLPKAAERLEIIRTELKRLDNIVLQFLSLAGPTTVNRQPVQIGEVIDYVCRLFAPEAATRDIELSAHVDAGLPPLEADRAQLTQALVNLVINALQAVERRGRVEVLARRNETPAALVVEVRDSGAGIDPQHAVAMFEPFYTTRDQGTGLGLWIVHQIVSAHGGRVQATNAPAGGAVFTLQLPVPATTL
ncbi:sensor histidine kinase [Opitutus terrae]|uniref:histidine kinase n=1 Tax=Opitutus terrae (strain DSM 11246 / JCM 15787 / PB90-1) TaxID=452637 RepID=B1ZR72_OPITP|nr:ATP-binding protein [Opitutus terrae]ACB74562.1 histidine kinase [Opitutus terrae PB90-1]